MIKNKVNFMKIFLCFIIIICFFNTNVCATNNAIDVSNSCNGYFSIYYCTQNVLKIKIKIIYNDKINYYDYDIGELSSYAFIYGDGLYTICMYQNVTKNLYRQIASKKIYVELEDDMSPYLISTYDVNFSENDLVSKTASEICKYYFMPFAKACAIHNYIYKNIEYDYETANNIINEKNTKYRSKAENVLNNGKGICYDKAVLFAAMCRSQGIPCKIVKGYYNDIYHAWNKIYVNNKWMDIDTSTTIDFIIKNGKRYKEKI